MGARHPKLDAREQGRRQAKLCGAQPNSPIPQVCNKICLSPSAFVVQNSIQCVMDFTTLLLNVYNPLLHAQVLHIVESYITVHIAIRKVNCKEQDSK